jgi:hypothetical protein
VPDDGAKCRTGVIGRAQIKSAGDNEQSDRDTYKSIPRRGDHTLDYEQSAGHAEPFAG